MNHTCYIVDDEAHAIRILSEFISRTPGLELIGSSTNPLQALEAVSSGNPPHLIFLDVDMPALSGLEFAGLVNSYSTVIFTTAYREYALDAFEQQAMDYILKPISYERFLQSIEKIRAHLHVRHLPAPAVEPFFFVKGGAGNKFIRIDAADITHITAASNYIEIYLQEQKILTYMSLGEVAAKLPAAGFSRIHKSHIVNHHFIKSLTYGQLTLNDDMKLPIGRVYRKAFHQLLKSSFRGGKQNGRT